MQPSYDGIRSIVLDALKTHCLDRALDVGALDAHVDLLQAGVLDSFGFLDFVEDVQQRTGISLDLEQVDVGELATIDKLIRGVLCASGK
ncbi:MAG: acyl carrier protein [Alphaproteobacteria bacterium]|nr:acyl carrier protein [Alphaproteobacteria bacterium]